MKKFIAVTSEHTMAPFKALSAFGAVIMFLFTVSVDGQLTGLTSPSATVTEGTDTEIPIVCNVMTAGAADTICTIVAGGGTFDAEFGYDIPSISGLTCTILAGDLSGTVTLPLINDNIMEATETISLDCNENTGLADLDIMIMEDPADTDMTVAFLTDTVYYCNEGGMVTYTVSFQDNMGNLVNVEEDLTAVGVVDFAYPRAMSTDTATIADADIIAPATFNTIPSGTTLNSMGAAVTGVQVIQSCSEDDVLENLEVFTVQLTLTGPTMTMPSTATGETRIRDNDRPGFYVVMDCTPIPRRSAKAVQVYAFTRGPNTGLTYHTLPFTPKDFLEGAVSDTYYNGIRYTFSKPTRNTRSRFNAYGYSVTETIGTPTARPFSENVYTFLSATSHKNRQAPIEFLNGPTVTVYPNVADCTDGLLAGNGVLLNAPCAGGYARQLRWFFVPVSGTANDIIRLKRRNGQLSFRITTCAEAGTYFVCRRNRCKRGWLDFKRVIMSRCVEGMEDTDLTMDDCAVASTVTCQNGGTLDPDIKLCDCPPGFAGEQCEIFLEEGQFGNSAEYFISQFFADSQRGRCKLYCFTDPAGCTCAPGYTGPRCCDTCDTGFFGNNCEHTCNCVDEACDRFTGVCANGCREGFSGSNCQTG